MDSECRIAKALLRKEKKKSTREGEKRNSIMEKEKTLMKKRRV